MTKSILIVGGAGGVGSAVVDTLVNQGNMVVTTVLDAAEAEAIQGRYDGAVKAHVVDLSDPEAVLTKIKLLVDALPALDAVAICAAVAPVGPMELTPLSTYSTAYDINCISAVSVYQATLPALRKTAGRIVLVSSIAGRAAYSFMSAYTATKFALEALGDVMRREAGPQGIKVSIVQPGGIRTNLVQNQITSLEPAYAALNEEDRERYGLLFKGYMKFSADSLRDTASTPDQVAAVVVEALDALEPETRYVAGMDAKRFFEMSRNMSDREIDHLFHQMLLG